VKGVVNGRSIALKSVVLRLSSSKVGVYGIHIPVRVGQGLAVSAIKGTSRKFFIFEKIYKLKKCNYG